MKPRQVSLDGVWDFQIGFIDPEEISAIQEWRTAVVPMPWQAQFADLRHTNGMAWYRRPFTIEEGWLETAVSQAAILHFGAVDYQATIWLNGEYIGDHEGGYLPFAFNVIRILHAGDNELLVRVTMLQMTGTATPIFHLAKCHMANKAGMVPSVVSGKASGWNSGPKRILPTWQAI